MITAILGLVGPIIMWAIKQFIRNAEERRRMIKGYYEFLSQVDKKSATKVANYIAAEDDLAKLRAEIQANLLVEPERPTEKNFESVLRSQYTIPEIKDVDVKMKTKGKYLTESGEAMGLVVHFTSGWSNHGDKDPIRTITGLAKRGLGCLAMGADGTIYKAKSQSLKDIAWHAGKSGWLGHSGISRYCMGMEICCGGKLESDGKTWFDYQVPSDQIRRISLEKNNPLNGLYQRFTGKQEKSLVNFILWQLDVNPEFKIEWIVAHHEISPGRKTDPGGSLSMTMDNFRDMIRKTKG